MNSTNLRTLRLIAAFVVGIAAFLAAKGEWASVGAALCLLLFFSAVVVWRTRRFSNPQPEPKDGEAGTRELISRVLPFLLILFVGLAVYDIVDEDWFGAGYAGVCFGAGLVGLFLNRRRLSEIESR